LTARRKWPSDGFHCTELAVAAFIATGENSKIVLTADSDEDAQAFRFDGALDSDMMSPRAGASLAW
jgi:hypothetical protein